MKWFLPIIFLFLICACQQNNIWQLQNINGHLSDLNFLLRDDQGRHVTEKNYKNKVTLLYFGFAGCGTQCPLVLQRLTHALQAIENNADRFQILFVSINPHDDPETLHNYLKDMEFQKVIGLTGSQHEIVTLAKRYRIAGGNNGLTNSSVHSDSVFIFDRNGHARLLLTPKDTEAALLHDLRQLK